MNIEQKDCWMKPTCKRYLSGNTSCEEDWLCYKFFYLNRIYAKSMLTMKQITTPLYQLSQASIDAPAYNRLLYIRNHIKEFTDNGKNLMIVSPNAGNGKTSWSVELLKSYFNSIWVKSPDVCRGMFVELSRYFASLKELIAGRGGEYAEEINKWVYTADLIVWDDVGVKTMTEFEYDHFLSIINSRLNSGKANIYTTNLTNEELLNDLTKRLYSRVVGYSEVIEFREKDHRRMASRNGL